MCVVSMIGDHYNDKWKERYPPFNPHIWPSDVNFPNQPSTITTITTVAETSYASKDALEALRLELQTFSAKFEELKAEVEECKALLIRAKEYDERNNEPHCEMEEKVALIKKMAELVGVDMSEVFPDK
jgi:hypothetical protein